jgi:uncharacterized membrane protein
VIFLPEYGCGELLVEQQKEFKSMRRAFSKRRGLHLLLLLIWTVVGFNLRFTNLADKPLWTDEFSTIVFSLGNSFLSVPSDQIITLKELLSPLVPDPQANVRTVINHLLVESNHPPLYFILSHFWLNLFATSDGIISVFEARTLPALLGAVSIPLTFLLGWLAFRCLIVAQIAAAFMAVSPFGIYLAQEARHYTLAIIWVIVSLYCMLRATQTIHNRIPLPLNICVTWVVANALGLATHYFFSLTLAAEALVVGGLGIVQIWQQRGSVYTGTHWKRIWGVAAGTIATVLVCLPFFLPTLSNNELTQWIYHTNRSGLEWLNPIIQAIAGWITMLYLLPIQAKSHLVVIISGVVLVLSVIWTVPKLWWGLKVQLRKQESQRLAVYVLLSFVGGAVLLFFGIVYFLSIDLTSVFRYHFVYFPAVIVLVGAGLASAWKTPQVATNGLARVLLRLINISDKKTVILIWLLSLLGGLTIITNLGYQKTHRPDVVAKAIRQESEGTVLIAIAHHHHGQTGRLMGIALSLQQHASNKATPLNPLFLLVHSGEDSHSAINTLNKSLDQLPHPSDLWLVNFQQVPDELLNTFLNQHNCIPGNHPRSVDGYRYRLYRCE